MNVELDGREMRDRAAVHAQLRARLELPDYYGNNLDALYDILTERAQPTTIVVRGIAEMEARLGGYAGAILKTLRQAAEENPALVVHMER